MFFMGLRRNKNTAIHQKAATVTARAAGERKQTENFNQVRNSVQPALYCKAVPQLQSAINPLTYFVQYRLLFGEVPYNSFF